MRAEGCDIRVDYRDMAYMGVVAVLQNLDKVKRNFRIAKQTLLQERPDVLILIDYPSFNLKMAKFCKKHLPHTKVVYYIPPKIWLHIGIIILYLVDIVEAAAIDILVRKLV